MTTDDAQAEAEREYPTEDDSPTMRAINAIARDAFAKGWTAHASRTPVVADRTVRVVAAGPETDASVAYREGRWCGECRYGQVEDPPCCTTAPVVGDVDAIARVLGVTESSQGAEE